MDWRKCSVEDAAKIAEHMYRNRVGGSTEVLLVNGVKIVLHVPMDDSAGLWIRRHEDHFDKRKVYSYEDAFSAISGLAHPEAYDVLYEHGFERWDESMLTRLDRVPFSDIRLCLAVWRRPGGKWCSHAFHGDIWYDPDKVLGKAHPEYSSAGRALEALLENIGRLYENAADALQDEARKMRKNDSVERQGREGGVVDHGRMV